jgi:hypothetical protein
MGLVSPTKPEVKKSSTHLIAKYVYILCASYFGGNLTASISCSIKELHRAKPLD